MLSFKAWGLGFILWVINLELSFIVWGFSIKVWGFVSETTPKCELILNLIEHINSPCYNRHTLWTRFFAFQELKKDKNMGFDFHTDKVLKRGDFKFDFVGIHTFGMSVRKRLTDFSQPVSLSSSHSAS